ncbi:MAG: ABC transporter ATP-binding protein [Bdellovibrio sp.]|nr:ABC transporter ATP-binding protein [Bdellovibrio sp.]
MTNAVVAQNLAKDFDGITAVKNISFEIKPGECFGILGPNGAGKSTTMKMIYGHVVPTKGDLFVLGLNARTDIKRIKSKIGVVPQEDGLDVDFNSLENLQIFASYYGVPRDIAKARAEHLLSEMKLSEQKFRHVEALSGGMKRRLAIARGMIHQPELLVLDEPTTGLDPQARLWIWNYFENLKAQKKTMILTTHYMEEAERLCDRVAMIDQGVMLDCASPAELVKKHIGAEVVEISSGSETSYWKSKLSTLKIDFQDHENKLFAFFPNVQARQSFIMQLQNIHYVTRLANLNDVFLKLAGYSMRGDA